jgi:hypothetical protein
MAHWTAATVVSLVGAFPIHAPFREFAMRSVGAIVIRVRADWKWKPSLGGYGGTRSRSKAFTG